MLTRISMAGRSRRDGSEAGSAWHGLEATGVNWWLIDDDGVGNPRFMRASPHTNKAITALRDVNNDGRCDVTVGTTTYLTGPRF